MGLNHALIDAFWISCDECGDVADDQNHESRASAATRAEDIAGFVHVAGKWLCPRHAPAAQLNQKETDHG